MAGDFAFGALQHVHACALYRALRIASPSPIANRQSPIADRQIIRLRQPTKRAILLGKEEPVDRRRADGEGPFPAGRTMQTTALNWPGAAAAAAGAKTARAKARCLGGAATLLLLLPLLLLLFTASSAFAAPPAEFVFEGQIRIDPRPPRTVRVAVPPGHLSVLPLEAGYLLHLRTPPPDEFDQVTHVFLVKPNGKHLQVLHDGITAAKASQVRDFGFVICGARVTYVPVMRAKLPTCAETKR